MKKITTIVFLCGAIAFAACSNNKKENDTTTKPAASTTPNKTVATNFNAEVDAAPGGVVAELNFVEKNDGKEIAGKQFAKTFEDSSKVVVTVYKKESNNVYDAIIYTINKKDAKGLKADFTPMNDGSDNLTTYSPKDFGAVSLVFVAKDDKQNSKIISKRSLSFFMGERKDETSQGTSLKFPVKDFKTAEQMIGLIKPSFK